MNTTTKGVTAATVLADFFTGELSNRSYREVIAAMEEYSSLLLSEREGKWISVKERLPELVQDHQKDTSESGPYIVLLSNGEVYRCMLSHWYEDDFIPEKFYWYYTDTGEICDKVTHWMSLPSPPKE